MGLLERRRYRSGKWGRLGDGVVDLIPDERIVRTIGKGCSQERLDTVEVEAVGINGGVEP
jgi:hypothetical protein